MAALEDVNAAHLAQRTVVDCSPGELRRVAVARALARIAADPAIELGLFDEPTAHLDPVSATAVRRALARLRGSVALIVATHDSELAALLNGGAQATALADTAAPELQATASTTPKPREELPEAALPKLSWRHLRALPLRSPRFALGVLLSALATLSAAALSGISGWLIVWAADQPPILYLMTLIVGVRAFGIGRSILRYCERLMTHDAVFRWAAQLRLRLWDSLGSSVLHWGKLSRSGGALGTLVADVDELRDAVPRAVVPLPAAILSYGAVLFTVFLMVPEVTGIVVALGVLALVVLPVVVRRGSATCLGGSRPAPRVACRTRHHFVCRGRAAQRQWRGPGRGAAFPHAGRCRGQAVATSRLGRWAGTGRRDAPDLGGGHRRRRHCGGGRCRSSGGSRRGPAHAGPGRTTRAVCRGSVRLTRAGCHDAPHPATPGCTHDRPERSGQRRIQRGRDEAGRGRHHGALPQHGRAGL
ncbi:hypothetical protein [Arthrobacter psychrolactophilus]